MGILIKAIQHLSNDRNSEKNAGRHTEYLDHHITKHIPNVKMKSSCLYRVPILGGAKFVGIISLLFFAFIAFFTWSEASGYEDSFLKFLDDPILEYTLGDDTREAVLQRRKIIIDAHYYFPYVNICIFGLAIVQILVNLLMICGIQCHKRGLIMPSIIINAIYSVIEVTLVIYFIVLMLMAVIPDRIQFGNGPTFIYLIAVPVTSFAFLATSIYFQLIVPLRAYVKMGITELDADPINYKTLTDTSDQNFKGGLNV